MNIGILGTGFGAYHAHILKSLAGVGRIVIYGRNESKLHKLQEELNIEISTSISDVIHDPELELIDICLPSSLHRQYTEQALQAGKHVFCETPLCLTAEDAMAMKLAEQQSGRKILVNQFIKFDPAYQYLYEAMQQQKYGKLLKVSLLRETAPLWGDLGVEQIATNLMIHDLDFLSWLLGGLSPSFVWGSQGTKADQSLVHAAFAAPEVTALITGSSAMPASYPFTVGYTAYFEQAKLEFYEKDDMQGGVDTALFEYRASGKTEIALDKVNPYEKSLQHALRCLQDGTDSILSMEHAMLALNTSFEMKNRLAENLRVNR